jgi:hypothetical protein
MDVVWRNLKPWLEDFANQSGSGALACFRDHGANLAFSPS